MNTLVVTDTSCLIALDRIGRLDVLPALFVVHAPRAVAEEFGSRPPWLRVEAVAPSDELDGLLRLLDPGEAEAIALARTYPNARLLIDEARGRKVAHRLGVHVTGTAGVLLAVKVAGVIPSLRPLLDALVHEHSFHLNQDLYEQTLRAAGEG